MMGLITRAAALLSLFTSVIAVPAPQARGVLAATPSNSTACAAVAQAQTRQMAANPQASPRVSAAQAFACLQSVPNKPEPAAKLINSFKAYVQWQTTLAWLKDPPQSYMLPPVDIEGELDAIGANATAGKFQSEYEFQAAIVQLVASAHDGHFAYRPDVFKAFSFRNDLAKDIVSVSVDGKQVPKLYNMAVLNGTTTKVGNMTLARNGTMPPAITKINGEDAAGFLERQALQFINFQDPDSQWNAQLPNYAVPTGQTVISASIFYQGNSVTLEYDNGQKVSQDSYALVRAAANFSGVNTGEDFYQRFCNPANSAGASSTQTQTQTPSPLTQAPAPAIPGFPMPMIRDSGANVTAGYFLNGSGYDDVAVLSVLGFAPESNSFDTVEYIKNFQSLVQDFLSMSKAANKKKLVIDVTGNGGGAVVAGYELYTQLFPNTGRFQANNLRRSESLQKMAQIAASVEDRINNINSSAVTQNSSLEDQALASLQNSAVVSNLIPGSVFSAGGKVNYTTVDEIISPVTLKGDQFVAYQDTPLNQTSSDFNLTGVGNRTNAQAAVFDPNNIVILTDGTCGSTCTLFSYLMIMQQNVKTVVVGGRPKTGPMQSIAGVEGAEVFDLENLQQDAAATLVFAPADQQASLNKSELGIIAEGYAIDRAAVPGAAGAVNGKNAFSHTDASTPLQFLYQAANCRFFYTKDMIMGPVATWMRAVDATFNDPNKFCVEGSQTPTMGVQNVSSDFFTTAAIGGARLSDPLSLGARSIVPRGWLAVLLAALVSTSFTF